MEKPPQVRGAISYGLGNLGTNIFSQAFATYILFFYIDHLRGPLGPITVAMSIQSVWHAVLNPAMGLWSDRTRTRWGRRLPYIAVGFIPLGIVFWLLWNPLVGHNGLIWYFLGIVALFDGFYLMVVINWTSLFPEMYRTLKARAEVARWRQGFGIVALMIGVSVPPLIYGRWGWSTMGAILAIVGTLGFMGVLWEHRRPITLPAPPTPSNEPLWRPFWQVLRQPGFPRYLLMNFLVQFVLVLIPAVMPFYAKYVLHLTHLELSLMLGSTFIVAILTVYPWSRLIQHWGAHRSLLIAITVIGIAVLPFLIDHSFLTGVLTAMALGIGLGGFLMLIDIVMAEIIDQHDDSNHVRREGAFYGMNGFVLRFGTTLEAIIVYVVFHTTGYHANAAGITTPAVREGIRFLMAGVPVIAIAVAGLAFRKNPAGDETRTSVQS